MTVWEVSATGYSSTDRICDTVETGKSLCDDLWACLSVMPEVVEDWQDLAVNGGQWVRYYRDSPDGEIRCQRITSRKVDSTGRWFR